MKGLTFGKLGQRSPGNRKDAPTTANRPTSTSHSDGKLNLFLANHHHRPSDKPATNHNSPPHVPNWLTR